MLRIFLTSFLLALVSFASKAYDVSVKGQTHVGKQVVCYASDTVIKVFTPPPALFLKSAGMVTDEPVFELELIGFSAEAETAFRYAVSIWESLIDSPVKIRLRAKWSALEEGVLGSCGPTTFISNFEGAPFDSYYPISLAEKVLGEEIQGASQPDMDANFNSNNDEWYLGTDGNTPPDKYDFVSVVLHEIGHGLGIIGFASVDGSQGGFTANGTSHGIFDDYIVNFAGQNLVDNTIFPNPSSALYTQFTGGQLNFDSEIAREDGDGSDPRLYAPSEWDSGSSIYHLNDATYGAGNENSLMTHAIASGEANHNPGPLLLGMLAEMGWKYTYIFHDEIADVESSVESIPVVATVFGDYGIDESSLKLHYTTTGWLTDTKVTMTPTLNKDEYSADIIPDRDNATVLYYITVDDLRDRTFNRPHDAPNSYYSFKIGEDSTDPTLAHTPVDFVFTSATSVFFEANAEDNIGIKSVEVEWRFNGTVIPGGSLSLIDGNLYSGSIDLPATLSAGDELQYRIIATDNSAAENKTTLPSSGYYTIKIEPILDAVSAYENNFNAPTTDFIGEQFTVSTESLFDDGALHSIHPYTSPEASAPYYEFVSILRRPIKLQEQTDLVFDEVVLVEPGAAGADFGTDDFFDYVVVEGSTDDGQSWNPFTDGWDSADNDTWLTAYNGGIDGDDSKSVGSKDHFLRRVIRLTASSDFNVGDEVLIRFRLYSDPYANGWGWCIDNLMIGSNVDVAQTELSPGVLRLYPNPAGRELHLELDLENQNGSGWVSLINTSGQVIYQRKLESGDGRFVETLSLDGYAPGIYLVNITTPEGFINRKVMKR